MHSQDVLCSPPTPSHEPEPDSTRRTANGRAFQLMGAERALMGQGLVPDLEEDDLVFVKFNVPSGTLIGRVHNESNHQHDDWNTAVAVSLSLELNEQWNNRVTKPLMSYRDFVNQCEQEIQPSSTAFVRAGGEIVYDWEHTGNWTHRIAHDVPRAAITKLTRQHFVA